MSRSNTVRTRESRRRLLKAGRALFGEHGFVATSTPMIAEAAGVSRGALYHHFEDKAALFAAVVKAEYEHLEKEIDRNILETTDPLEVLIEGGDNFISAASDPITQRILFLEGPTVLTSEGMLTLDSQTTTKSLLEGIEAAQAAGRLPDDIPSRALASMMSGAYDRAVADGMGACEEERLSIRQAIRCVWFGLSKLA
ncbi:MAG: TetR/AcrR family transcriptional regulator [Pseudomonadota bacterium]